MYEKIIEFKNQLEMEKYASNFARHYKQPQTFALYGDLGTGKTTFAREFIRELLGRDTIIPSPTFTIIQTYKDENITINHFDLYRLTHKEELIELDIPQIFENSFTLIEWPELSEDFLPKNAVKLHFFIKDKNYFLGIQS